MRKVFSLTLFLTFFGLNLQAQSDKLQAAPKFTRIDFFPRFPGDIDSFIRQNLRYPEGAREKGLEGRVVVKIILDETGRVTRPEIAQSAHPALDSEALRVVSVMPRWKPAVHAGKPVSFPYFIAVKFGSLTPNGK